MSGFQRAQTIRDAISGRRSIRQYSSDDVSPDTVRRLIGMAVMAPSAHNRQPWRFVVVRDADIKLRLADAMGVRLKNDRTRDGDDPAAIQRDVARSHLRISKTPVLLAVCLTMEDMDRYPDERRNRAEFLMAVQSTAVAVENLMVAASGEGLGTCWMCAPLFCPDVARAVLELPVAWEPQALVTLGQPAVVAKQKPRKPFDEVVVVAGLDPASHSGSCISANRTLFAASRCTRGEAEEKLRPDVGIAVADCEHGTFVHHESNDCGSGRHGPRRKGARHALGRRRSSGHHRFARCGTCARRRRNAHAASGGEFYHRHR